MAEAAVEVQPSQIQGQAPAAIKGGKQGDPYPVEYVRLADCDIDMHVQRPIVRNNVDKIKTEFDWRLFNPPVVYRNSRTHQFTVIAGQHHFLAAKELLGEDQYIHVKVVPEPSKEEAARLGLLDNIGQMRPTSVSEWHSLVKSGDPKYVAVDAVIHSYGVRVGSGTGAINGVRAFERFMHDRSLEEAVEMAHRVMTVICTAWKDSKDPYRFQAVIIKNICILLDMYPEVIDASDFGERLGAKDAQHFCRTGPSNSQLVGYEMLDLYNARRRSENRLTWTNRKPHERATQGALA